MILSIGTLEFDEVSHRYLLDGRPVPSVTRVISNINEDLMLSTPFMRKTAIGTNVHKICEMINNGERVNISALGEDIRPYVEGYNSFLLKEKYQVIASELRVFSPKFRFAGTLDILARGPKGLALMDIKTSAIVSPITALQLAAYQHCVEEMTAKEEIFGADIGKKARIKERVCIWLTGDGEYELVHYKDPGDWNTFLCKLVSFNWDKKMGLK